MTEIRGKVSQLNTYKGGFLGWLPAYPLGTQRMIRRLRACKECAGGEKASVRNLAAERIRKRVRNVKS